MRDQVLPHPSDPGLHESYVESAGEYVALAERANGPISKPVDLWLRDTLNREGNQPALRFLLKSSNQLVLRWDRHWKRRRRWS